MRVREVKCKDCDAHGYCCKVLEEKAMKEVTPPQGKALCDVCHGARYIRIDRYPKEDAGMRCGRCNGTGWIESGQGE